MLVLALVGYVAHAPISIAYHALSGHRLLLRRFRQGRAARAKAAARVAAGGSSRGGPGASLGHPGASQRGSGRFLSELCKLK